MLENNYKKSGFLSFSLSYPFIVWLSEHEKDEQHLHVTASQNLWWLSMRMAVFFILTKELNDVFFIKDIVYKFWSQVWAY